MCSIPSSDKKRRGHTRSGRHSTSRTEHTQSVDALISEDQQIMLAQEMTIMGISCGFEQATVHDDFGDRKVCAR